MKGKVVIVTGGSPGIGRATAIAFGREGCLVTVAARREAESMKTVRLVKEAGGDAQFVQTDITMSDQVANMVDRTVRAFGGLDYAFNNAADMTPRAGPAEWHDVTEETWNQQIDTGLKGVWLSMKYELPALLARGGGAIVNNSSVAGLVGASGGPYTAAKHGVIGLTKSAAVRYGRRGIRINAVCPGVITSQVWQSRIEDDEEYEAALKKIHPVGRLGTPDEVAQAVVWLCSDKSLFITGEYLVIDGGLLTPGVDVPVKKPTSAPKL